MTFDPFGPVTAVPIWPKVATFTADGMGSLLQLLDVTVAD